jgi:RNA polymerase sigma-70 factor (ECF subfamily)
MDVVKVRADANDDAELVALVARAQRRDPRAEAELFERFAGNLAGILERLLGSVADAEDALQDTFVIALSQLGRLRDPAAAGAWLTGIAVHQAQRRFRRRRLLRVLGLDRGVRDAGLAELAAPTTPPEVRETLRRLDGFLAELAPSLRLAWMLRNVEGESLTDIARACRCSLATAKRRIATADARLRKQLNIGDEP